MSRLIKILFLVIFVTGKSSFSLANNVEVILPKAIFTKVPFSSQYSNDGSLIRNIDYRSVKSLIPQLEKKFNNDLKGRKLQDRNEAHITVITPPEGKTGFFNGSIGIDKVFPTSEMINMFKDTIQNTTFDIVCVGMQKNTQGHVVFYLVVKSEDILSIRKRISTIVSSEDPMIPFNAVENYYPHITIGFVGGDIHGVSKGEDTCVAKVQIQ